MSYSIEKPANVFIKKTPAAPISIEFFRLRRAKISLLERLNIENFRLRRAKWEEMQF